MDKAKPCRFSKGDLIQLGAKWAEAIQYNPCDCKKWTRDDISLGIALKKSFEQNYSGKISFKKINFDNADFGGDFVVSDGKGFVEAEFYLIKKRSPLKVASAIGHYALHSLKGTEACRIHHLPCDETEERVHQEAFYFSLGLMMPDVAIKSLIDSKETKDSFNNQLKLVSEFNVFLNVAAIRLKYFC